ncbi:MAG: sensor histidine kinase [Acidobacteria bacterium]|nr:sensor histidine kinase [Acidobacteriota bacterium]
MNNISIRFALLMGAAAVLPLLAFGAVSILSVGAGAEQAVIEGNLNVAIRAAEQIDQYFSGSVRLLRAVAADLSATGLEPWQQDRILKNYSLDFDEFAELSLIDPQGKTLATSRIGDATVSVPDDGVPVGGVTMAPFVLDDDLLPTSVLAVPIGDPEDSGWLVARLNLEDLWLMVDRLRVGRSGFASVVTGSGQYLAHGDPAERQRVARGEGADTHPLFVQLAASTQTTTAALTYRDHRGELVGVASRVPALGWLVLVEQPTAEAFVIPLRLRNQIGVAILGALVTMLSIGYVAGRRFIDPILALTSALKAVADGRLNARVRVTSSDELGQLEAGFNQMAGRLGDLQEDVRRKERQAMLGRMAVGLVHDLAHPIQNIGNSCKLIVRLYDDPEYRDSFRRTVERELAEVQRVMQDLRHVAKPLPVERHPIDVNQAVLDLVESIRPEAQEAGVALHVRLSPLPLTVDGDLFSLNRACRNLIINAVEATQVEGTVTVLTRAEGREAAIEVTDTGSGIPAERLPSVFDDFVTTKRRGLGLGLAIARTVVDQLGGRIEVRSVLGQGTTFTVHLVRAIPAGVGSDEASEQLAHR